MGGINFYWSQWPKNTYTLYKTHTHETVRGTGLGENVFNYRRTSE